ncbi:MAG: GNAT family N-acetyltransferase [Alphaproteobacteria bacterium]
MAWWLDGAEGAARWAALLEHPGTIVLGAEVDGLLVAIVTLHILPNMTFGGRPYALIENVVTAQAYRGRGIGRRTMEEAVAAAWAAGASKIMLLTGPKRGVRGVYEQLGFTDEKVGMTMRAPRQPGDA